MWIGQFQIYGMIGVSALPPNTNICMLVMHYRNSKIGKTEWTWEGSIANRTSLAILSLKQVSIGGNSASLQSSHKIHLYIMHFFG